MQHICAGMIDFHLRIQSDKSNDAFFINADPCKSYHRPAKGIHSKYNNNPTFTPILESISQGAINYQCLVTKFHQNPLIRRISRGKKENLNEDVYVFNFLWANNTCSFSIHTFIHSLSLGAHLVSSSERLPTGQSHGRHGDGEGAVNNCEKSMSKITENKFNIWQGWAKQSAPLFHYYFSPPTFFPFPSLCLSTSVVSFVMP